MKKVNLDLKRHNGSLLMNHFSQNDMKLLVQLVGVSWAISCVGSDKVRFGDFLSQTGEVGTV